MKPRLLDLLPRKVAVRISPVEDGCWECSGWHNPDGYSYVMIEGQSMGIHRLVMQVLGYEIDGMDVDHRCRNRGCVNPAHLDVVTHAVNMARTRPNGCRRAGHDWSDPHNFYTRRNGTRYCAECARQNARRRYVEAQTP